ncbi:MAG: CotH kinase family protein [Butyricicoccus porcorum]|nr:CotH kinase family protein [Butyricicoccus porcorum]
MIPWDYNLAFGGFMSSSDSTELVNYPIDSPVSGGTIESRPMLAWIFSNETYTEQYHQYFAEWIADYFDSGYFSDMIDRVQEMIAPYVEKDPTKFCTYEEFETGIETLKEFCLLRADSVRGQLDGSIASTSDGRAQNPDGRIDASDLTISDMGTMNHGKGGDTAQPAGDKTENEDSSAVSERTVPNERGSSTENGTQPDVRRQPGQPGNGQDEPAMASDAASQQDESMQPGVPSDENSNVERSETTRRETQSVSPDQAQSEPIDWRLLIPSVMVLAAGIILAGLYRKRV